MNGRDTRSSTDQRSDLRVRLEEETGVLSGQEGMVASPPPSQPSLRRGNDALADTLGAWLNDNHQAEIRALSEDLQRKEIERLHAEEGRQVYRSMWNQAEDAVEATRYDMQFAIHARDRVLSMLLATTYRYSAKHPDATADEQLELVSRYIDQLIETNVDQNYETSLLRPADVQDATYQDILREELVDMSTDEDTEDEIIDLTMDSDDDDEEL